MIHKTLSSGGRALAFSSLIAFAFALFLSISEAQAAAKRAWVSVPVPDAVCGDGQPYSVFIDRKDPKRLAFAMMGGGACWDAKTCFGPLALTRLHQPPAVLDFGAFLSTSAQDSPVADHTMVYFPYCTGDVHIGSHVANYGLGRPNVHHMGGRNFELALAYLAAQQVDFRAVDEFVMYGFSAGAIGALVHSLDVAPYLTNARKKAIVADSPGLHFGPTFWHKFSPALMSDITAALAKVGVTLNSDEGNVAEVVPKLCGLLPDWDIGVLQGSRDWVMSLVFGETTARKHEQSVYGPNGIVALTADPTDRCSSWAPRTPQHTFLVQDFTTKIKAGGKPAHDYVFDLVSGNGGLNYSR